MLPPTRDYERNASRPEDAASQVIVRVPATSANLGPGFDSLALALDLHNLIEVRRLPAEAALQIDVEGEGAQTLARDESNLVVAAMARLAAVKGRALPPFSLRLHNTIPLGRGLGSSAAAIAGGLLAAAALLDLPRDPAILLPVALGLESHPDNIAAALWGGITIGVLDEGAPVVRRIAPPDLRAVLMIPDAFASTTASRAVLPAMVPRADAIFNAGRCALLALALAEGRYDLLRVAMQDRLHQPCRGAREFPYLEAAIEAALAAGADGAALSGAGSSVLALTGGHEEDVATALARVARDHDLPARTLILRPAAEGATLLSA